MHRNAPRGKGALVRKQLTLVLCVLLGSLALGTGAIMAANDLVSYNDAALGVVFVAPRSLNYLPATRTDSAFVGQTTTARLSSYPILTEKRPGDYRNEILVELSIVVRDAATLDDLARGHLSLPATTMTRGTAAGRDMLLLTGTFANGPREMALIPLDTKRVLLVQAFPAYSTRIAVFHQVLASLALRGN